MRLLLLSAIMALFVFFCRLQYAFGVCDMAENFHHLAGPHSECVSAVLVSGEAQ